MKNLIKEQLADWLVDHPQFHHWLIEAGLRRVSTNYTRFIILGRSRTGSNFLRGLLASRPDVLVLGEILKNPEKIEWGMEGFPHADNTDAVYRIDPAAFLNDHIFRPLPPTLQAVGFKLFYYHSRQADRSEAWQYLQSQQNIHVIHIKRRNILKTFLSWTRANQEDRWVAQSEPVGQPKPVSLSYEDCLQEFETTRQWEQEADQFFSDHPLLELFYEDLAADYQQIMNKVQQFLKLDVKPLDPQTYKQARLPLNQAILNFGELKQKFHGSQWEEFFEEH